MKKTARLDHILLKMGTATEGQIARALARQRTHGGRFGENLLKMGVINEGQLLAALSEQFQIPTANPTAEDIPLDLLRQLPRGVVLEDLILPLGWNETRDVLTLAVADPLAEAGMTLAKAALKAEHVHLVLASERIVENLGLRLLSGDGDEADPDAPGIELPELFAHGDGEGDSTEEQAAEEEEGELRVLMISQGAPHKNFLPPVFLREGVDLVVTSSAEEAAEAISGGRLQAVLVTDDMEDSFRGWIKDRKVGEPETDVVIFPSVSRSLLGNPVEYESMVRSVKAALQALADFRCAHYGSCPPYGLIVHDLDALAHTYRLSRLARDGLHLAAHLLLPTTCEYTPDPVGSAEPFQAFSSSLELATRIRFPWRLDTVLDACHGLFSGRASPDSDGRWGQEILRAAQLLAIVWYRHNHVPIETQNEEEAMIALRSNLRDKAGKLATLRIIEGYLSLIQERGSATATGFPRQIILVGRERISRALAQGLSRLGCQVIPTSDLVQAQFLAERSPPGAIVLDQEEFPEEAERFVRLVRLDGSVPLYVVTDSTDPTLVLNLLDIGADDVFGPPHEFDLMAARLNHAVRSRARQTSGRDGAGQFSATFEVFSFMDLIQTLGHGMKSVRIELSRGDGGEQARLFMERGRLIHATAGESTGAEAVYRIIEWEDEGEFTVHQESVFPTPAIVASTESLLMEGCRRLDEMRAHG